ncbi:MAG: glycosidase [Rhodothermia bacterium]|nr:MAG: glycosidase [Rhodothermia bacterium]
MTTRLFERTPDPVLEPDPEIPWATGAVFNPGVWRENGTTHLLFRAIPSGYRKISLDTSNPAGPTMGFDSYISYIGYASSLDGIHFEWRREPFISPDSLFDRHGVEDPRVSKIDETYLITYTALSSPAFLEPDGTLIGLATTQDFSFVEKHGDIGPPVPSKDTVVFPRRIRGRIAMLHRIVPNIQLILFDDLEQLYNPPERVWQEHIASLDDCIVMRPEQEWEAKKIGAGPTPIETKAGWLLIYHGVDRNHVYRVGLALLDLDDPRKVIGRSSEPVMVPETPYELVGDVNNVIFPQGAAVIEDTLHLYYGAADRVIGHASASLPALLDYLTRGAGPR